MRKRPLSEKELASGEHKDIIHCSGVMGSELTVLEYRKRLDLTEYVGAESLTACFSLSPPLIF